MYFLSYFQFCSGLNFSPKLPIVRHNNFITITVLYDKWVQKLGGGARNMKSMWLPSMAIFFMTYFTGTEGVMAPRPPQLDLLLSTSPSLHPGPFGSVSKCLGSGSATACKFFMPVVVRFVHI